MKRIRIALTLLTLTMAALIPVADAGTLVETLDALKAPSLGADARTVTDVSWTWANTDFTFSGDAESIIADGTTIGFALSGQGTINLRVVQGPFYQANISTLNARGQHDGDTVRRSFQQAVFFTKSEVGGFGEGEPATSSALAETLSRTIERMDETYYGELDAMLAPDVFNRTDGVQVFAMLWTDDGKDLVYALDTVVDRDEALYQWDKNTRATPTYFRLEGLVEQLVSTKALKARPTPDIRQTAIHIEVTSPDNEMVYETTETTLTAERSGIRMVSLGLTNGRSKERKHWDEHDDPFSVTSVTTADGANLEFAHRSATLLVLLPKALNAGQSVDLVIKAEGRLLKSYRGDSFFVLGNMDWFPSLSFMDTQAPVRVTVKVKEPWSVIAVGKDVRRWTEEGGVVALESYEDNPVSFPFVVVGEYVTTEEKKGPYEIKIHSYVMAKKRGAKALARNGIAILDFYSNGLENFPYGELEVVEIPYFNHFFWQAPSGIVEITSEGLSPTGGTSDRDALIRRYASKGQNSRYAHEIAHQWFGNLVGPATPYDNWISESFAEYLSYLFMTEGARDKKKAKVQLKEWTIDVNECSDKSSVYGASALSGSTTNQRCYTQLLYGKGPYVLHALRQDMGDENFKKMLYFLTVQAKKKNMKVITEDIIQFASLVGGKDYRPWFDKYVYGTEIPPLEK